MRRTHPSSAVEPRRPGHQPCAKGVYRFRGGGLIGSLKSRRKPPQRWLGVRFNGGCLKGTAIGGGVREDL